jgi:SRSO17 transposase
VVVDAGYGDNPNFLQGLDARQVPYVCAVQSTFGCRLPEEVQAIAAQMPVYAGRGQPRKPRPAPLYTVKELIAALPASAWQTIGWREGTQGTMRVQAVALRVHWATGSSLHSTSHSRVHTGPQGWLLAERPVPATLADDAQSTQDTQQEKEEEKIKYWFSVLPEDASLQRLILLAHARWVIEQFYARCQTGVRLRSLPGTKLGGLASTPGPGYACL